MQYSRLTAQQTDFRRKSNRDRGAGAEKVNAECCCASARLISQFDLESTYAVRSLPPGYNETLMAMAIPGCRRLYM